MKKTTISILLLFTFELIFNSEVLSQNIMMKKSVMGTCGMIAVTNSKGVQINAIANQMVIGKVLNSESSSHFDLNQGFWIFDPTPITAVNESYNPISSKLFNYPNPVNSSTSIVYNLEVGGFVTIVIYNMLGNEVKSLVNSNQTSGDYMIVWDTKNDDGVLVGSGSYLYELKYVNNSIAGPHTSKNYVLHNVMVISR